MDINKMMTNEIFTTNGKTHSQNMNSTQYQNHAITDRTF